MADDDDMDSPGPHGWDESWRASLWRFDNYRRVALPPRMPTARDYELVRHIWENMPIPPEDPPRRFPQRVRPLRRRYLVRNANRALGLDDPTPDNPRESYVDARIRRDIVRNFFAPTPDLQYMRTLGYGGNGLAIHYKYNGPDPIDFVVKVALRGWESESLRHEEKNVKKMSRAAHSVQLIGRPRIGIPENRPFEFDLPLGDDSSEEGESSGDESRDDEPSPEALERRTRREIIEADPEAARQKEISFSARTRAAEQRRNDRVRMLRQTIFGPIPDIYDQDRKDFMVLEFCELGDLEKLLYNEKLIFIIMAEFMKERPAFQTASFGLFGFVVGQPSPFCNTELTKYLVVRACLGMQYPPRKFHPRRREDPPGLINGHPDVSIQYVGKMVGEDLFEELPDPRRRWAAKRFVHFDIDIRNVFISGIDVWARDNEHRIVPRIKLADFGTAEEIKPRKRNSYYFNQRHMAKYGYYAPEQFGSEWNYIVQPDGSPVDIDGPEVSEEPIAGNYGSATNVWGIALVLWQLMTQMRAPVPPQLQRKSGLHADLPYNYCACLLTEAKYEVYDVELRTIVARCMAHDPQERPTPGQLLQSAKRGIDKRFDGEPDDIIAQWIQTFLWDP
ncbi:kinase-like domain-containing protein [Xylaria sp. FL1777]|nr:kinase-like domain-containing protein [Xylaria sp. FL1777]